MHEALKVYLKDSFVGWLSHETRGDAFSFRYEPRYLADPAEGALSFALPLSDEAFDTERTYGFFANLLPPAAVRQRLGASLHLSRNNVFGFLRAIGGDCAGAVSLHPEGARPTPQDVERTRELSEEEAVAILRSLRRRPLYAAGEAGYRYSGAGAQDKLIARVKDGRVILPLYGTPSTHIVKPPADGFPDSVENEFFCERLATALGLAAARCDILVLGGGRHYVSERYDREIVGGRPRRLHQEDFCQLLSVDPESKYEEDGGPTIPQCLDVLRRMRDRREQLHIKDGDGLLRRLDRRAGGDQRGEVAAAGDGIDRIHRFVDDADEGFFLQTAGDKLHPKCLPFSKLQVGSPSEKYTGTAGHRVRFCLFPTIFPT